MRIALATAIAAFALDDDMPPLREALQDRGHQTEPVAWDDPTVAWSRFDLVLLRSTWNYTERPTEFLAWCERVAATTRLLNPPALVRWNIDKHYLADLASKGVPVIPAHFLASGDDPASFPPHAEFVVKPCIGAGSRDTQRYTAPNRTAAIAHVKRLLDGGRHVLVQPYLEAVDTAGETALLFFAGRFSHAIRKGPLLQRDGAATAALFAPEAITPREPSAAEFEVAHRALAAIPGGAPLYARVDLLPSPDGPQLLELELTEPSLFFEQAPGSAERFVAAIEATLAHGAQGHIAR
jgi:glutathione synthase/RimK-type ligase-like ATP-grasp enzyme